MGGTGTIGMVFTLAGSMAAPAIGTREPNVRFQDAAMRERVSRAVEGAIQRLRRSECAGVLGEFRDASGRSLSGNLEALEVPAPEYLERILFYPGHDLGHCAATGVLAVTQPRSRVVLVCRRFFREALFNPEFAEAVIIHEALHTLGLGENPPSSREITARVLERCH